MDTRIGTYKYPILNNGAGYVSTAYPMRSHIQSARDTGYAGYGTYPRRLADHMHGKLPTQLQIGYK
jgi:hypothetical protein